MAEVTQDDIMIIIESAGVTADLDKIRNGDELSEAGVDSLDLANILLAIEEKYDIKIPDEDVNSLATIGNIVSYLHNRKV